MHEGAHFASFAMTRKVIEVHGSVMEVATAVRARSRFLEATVPGFEFSLAQLPELNSCVARLLPVGGVVRLPTALAPSLPAPLRRVVKRGDRLTFAASAADEELFHVAIIDISSDGVMSRR